MKNENNFEVMNQQKLADQFEDVAAEWILKSIELHYGIDNWDELSREQVDGIYAYAQTDHAAYVPYVQSALILGCDDWYEMNEDS